MNKATKRNVLASALLSIMLCVSLIAGATYALFTSESKVNVAVTSGKVNVVATADENSVQTKQLNEEYETGKDHMFEAEATFENGSLTLTKLVPGDGIKFNIEVENKSDVTVKYRTLIVCEKDEGLLEGLDVTIGEEAYKGTTKVSQWEILAAEKKNVATVPVTIELPEDAGSEYSDKTLKLTYKVEAVQGNADTSENNDVTYIYSVNDLIAFSNNVAKGKTYEGKKVLLMNDLDLKGSSFNGVGPANVQSYGGNGATVTFRGTFDGQNHTISNMTVSSQKPLDASVGLFNSIGENAVIRNVTVKKAVLNSTRYAGGIVGYAHCETRATVENCSVIDSSVTSIPELLASGEFDNGDKVGGVIGYAVNVTVDSCTVKKTEIFGYRDLGGVVGMANTGTVVTNNTIEDVSIKVNKTYNYKGYTTDVEYGADSIFGRSNIAEGNISNNTGEATITYACFVCKESDLWYIAQNGLGASNDIILLADIDLQNKEWTPLFMGGTFDGNGHTIYNLKVSADACSDTGNGYGAALIYWSNGDIKNLTIDGANIEGYHNAGAIVGVINSYASFGIENCHVKNATITITHKDATLCGDKAGAIAGRIAQGKSMKDCTAENCVVKGCRDVGQLFGAATVSKSFGCEATNVTASEVENSTCNDSSKGANIKNEVIGRDLG